MIVRERLFLICRNDPKASLQQKDCLGFIRLRDAKAGPNLSSKLHPTFRAKFRHGFPLQRSAEAVRHRNNVPSEEVRVYTCAYPSGQERSHGFAIDGMDAVIEET